MDIYIRTRTRTHIDDAQPVIFKTNKYTLNGVI